ncbi:MAG: glycosyltransferase, partial [Oligoflexia bacterium]|nr:glycosyltransferase [Oligoflexia bacterium]
GRAWALDPPSGSQPDLPADDQAPLISVCIPARNEADNIGACVQAVRAQRWPRVEIIVVDDQSEDGTGDAARAAAADDVRVRVIRGTPPPAAWAGKPWACARAAGESTGDRLLFLDADVVLHPDALTALQGAMADRSLALLSVYGTWELVSFWERVVVPAVGWLIRGAIDLNRVNDPGAPEAFANGQCILVDRSAYEAVDGHGVVRDQVLDDVGLATAFKQRGFAIALLVAPWAFRVRLYRSLGEIVGGYGKNLYEGMGRQPILGLGSVLFIVVGALVPFGLLAGGLVARLLLGWAVPAWAWLGWIAAVCGLQIAFRWRIERRDGRSGSTAWWHPVANVLLAFILLRAVLGVRSRWKGREFVDGRAAPQERHHLEG